jgi:hypothetical protein
MTQSREISIPPRFRGPPGMVNGGFACGSLAALGRGDVEVTLRRPVPLGRRLRARANGDGSLLLEDGDTMLATARPADAAVDLAVPDVVTPEQARAAAGRSRYYDDPLFPGCFVCGTARAPGDGLRVFAGLVPGTTSLAAPWTPDRSVTGEDGRVRPEVVWAALDCPGGLAAVESADLPGDTAILLGRMTATLAGRPEAGDDCRVVAWPIGHDGRKHMAGSALLDADGQVLAAARTVWISVPRPEPERAR